MSSGHVQWETAAVIVGGFAAIGVPAIGAAARHIGRTFQAKADEAVKSATRSLHARIDRSDARVDEKVGAVDAKLDGTNERLIKVEAQLNGTGLRGRVDEIAQGQARIEGRLDQLSKDR